MRRASTLTAVVATVALVPACGGGSSPAAPGDIPTDDPVFALLETRQRHWCEEITGRTCAVYTAAHAEHAGWVDALQGHRLVGPGPDLDRGGQTNRALGVERLVDPSDGGEDRLELALHVRPVGVELHLQPGGPDHLVGAPDLRAHRDPGPDGDDLDLGEGLHDRPYSAAMTSLRR